MIGPDRDNERLMLKDKEVVADPQRQYEIARQVHAAQHAGINKTTATIAEKHHWVRIKETVSLVIKNCPDCKDTSKVPTVRPVGENSMLSSTSTSQPSTTAEARRSVNANGHAADPNSMIERLVNFDDLDTTPTGRGSQNPVAMPGHLRHGDNGLSDHVPVAQMHALQNYSHIPLDPQIMQQQHPHAHLADDAHFDLDLDDDAHQS